MRMARWAVAWAAWTCNTGFADYSQRERASAGSFLWCARQAWCEAIVPIATNAELATKSMT
jgi:hypothetical protein